VGAFLLVGVLLVRGRQVGVALCLRFLPTEICDSCVWLVTGYGYMIHSDLSIFILCHLLFHAFFFFRAIFGAFLEGFSWGGFGGFFCGICSGNHTCGPGASFLGDLAPPNLLKSLQFGGF
jgi:hypothetical protein